MHMMQTRKATDQNKSHDENPETWKASETPVLRRHMPPRKNMPVRRPWEVEEEDSTLEVMSASHVCVSPSVHQSCYEEEPDCTLQMLASVHWHPCHLMHSLDVEVTVSTSNMIATVQDKKTQTYASVQGATRLYIRFSYHCKLYVVISNSTCHVVASVRTIKRLMLKKYTLATQ